MTRTRPEPAKTWRPAADAFVFLVQRPRDVSSFRAEPARSAGAGEESPHRVIPSGARSAEARNRRRPDQGRGPLPGRLRFLAFARNDSGDGAEPPRQAPRWSRAPGGWPRVPYSRSLAAARDDRRLPLGMTTRGQGRASRSRYPVRTALSCGHSRTFPKRRH